METIEKLETTIGGWFKDFPRLPKGLTAWLADNIWWLTIVGIVISVFASFVALSALLFIFGISGFTLTVSNGFLWSAVAGIALISALVGIAGLLIDVVLMAMAVSPLKMKAKKGWTLLFVLLLFNFAFAVAGSLVSLNIIGVLAAALMAGVEAYILFEIRSYFGVTRKVASKTKATV